MLILNIIGIFVIGVFLWLKFVIIVVCKVVFYGYKIRIWLWGVIILLS